MFEGINLSHKGTLKRVEFCLNGINGRLTFGVDDLDALCGQRNKPLGKLLRMLFLQLPTGFGKKSGERQLYCLDPHAVTELRERFVTHTTNTGLVAE